MNISEHKAKHMRKTLSLRTRLYAAWMCLKGKPVLYNIHFVNTELSTNSEDIRCIGLYMEGRFMMHQLGGDGKATVSVGNNG